MGFWAPPFLAMNVDTAWEQWADLMPLNSGALRVRIAALERAEDESKRTRPYAHRRRAG